MAENRQEVERGTGVRLDLTLNVPTLLAIAGMIAGSITYINGQIQALNNQLLTTIGDVKVLQTQLSQQGMAYSSLRNDTASQLVQFRSEYKQDMRDLKDGIERLNQNNGR